MSPLQPDHHQPSAKPTTQAYVHRKLFDYYRDHPAIFGGADILNLHFATPQVRTSIYVDILSCIRRRNDDRPVVQKIVVVVPYGQEIADYANTPSLLSVDAPDVPEPLVTLANDPRFRGRLQIVSTKDCRHESVLSVLREQPVRTAAIVVDAAIYRNEHVSPFPVSDSSARPEDFWAPQLHALAAEAVDVAIGNNMYLLLDTGQFHPDASRPWPTFFSQLTTAAFSDTLTNTVPTTSVHPAPSNGTSGSTKDGLVASYVTLTNCPPSPNKTGCSFGLNCSTGSASISTSSPKFASWRNPSKRSTPRLD